MSSTIHAAATTGGSICGQAIPDCEMVGDVNHGRVNCPTCREQMIREILSSR